MNEPNFQLKGSAVTAIVLELYQYDTQAFRDALQEKVSQAPALFTASPIVVQLDKLESTLDPALLATLLQDCQSCGLQPMALRLNDEQAEQLTELPLPRLPALNSRSRTIEPEPSKATSEVVVKTVVEEKIIERASKIVTRPVRSGQQVYAEGTDLIILAPVSEGAEILADGSIHVYGPLRGRALAGVKGNTQARVFCQSLEAELISIAGNFKLSDALRAERWKQAAHISYQDDQLIVMPL